MTVLSLTHLLYFTSHSLYLPFILFYTDFYLIHYTLFYRSSKYLSQPLDGSSASNEELSGGVPVSPVKVTAHAPDCTVQTSWFVHGTN